MTTAPSAIRIQQLSRHFGETVALSFVDLHVERGEMRALLGPNGAGKTTLLRVVSGSVRPTSGTVEVMGHDWSSLSSSSSRSLFGLVTSGERSSYYRLSGLENLLFFGRLHGLQKRDARVRAVELLEQVGLSEAASVRTGLYSHGMQKRLSLARALITHPPVLLVDEATHDLDPMGARMVRDLLKKEAASGVGILWATQRVDEIQDTADNVTVLHRGEVRFSGRVDDLARMLETRRYRIQIAAGSSPEVQIDQPRLALETLGSAGVFRLSLTSETKLGEAIVALQEAGLHVIDCRPEASSIEDAFLSLTDGTLP